MKISTVRLVTQFVFFADNDYQMKCYWDDKGVGVFVIEFDYQDVGLSGWELAWEKI